ncbi:MAG: SDR family NAD(P)-dependent oxidoreductase [Pseudomonadota bacterium]
MSTFNKDSSSDEVIAGLSLAGKTAVVTGASAGIGIETCRALAATGVTVVMVARDSDKLARARAQIIDDAGEELALETVVLDLADLDAVRRGAAEILARFPEIDMLINNAGVMACPLLRTAQGFEMQFGTNHVGHFLLTCLLAPALVAGSRVVNLSSTGHYFSDILWQDPNYERSDYSPWQAYGQSKTANVLFSVALDARLKGRGVRAFAVHPGAIHTELGRHLDEATTQELMSAPGAAAGWEFKTVAQGAATSLWAATSPTLDGQGALFLEDCQVAPARADDQASHGVESYALDPEAAERLWTLSEELVGQRFPL